MHFVQLDIESCQMWSNHQFSKLLNDIIPLNIFSQENERKLFWFCRLMIKNIYHNFNFIQVFSLAIFLYDI